jgi:hypothetical protein
MVFGTEEAVLAVIKGEADCAGLYTKQPFEGLLLYEKLLYRVEIDNLSVDSVEKLFKTLSNMYGIDGRMSINSENIGGNSGKLENLENGKISVDKFRFLAGNILSVTCSSKVTDSTSPNAMPRNLSYHGDTAEYFTESDTYNIEITKAGL